MSRRRRARRHRLRERPASYYVVLDCDLREEMERLCELPVFNEGRLARRAPELNVRRASSRPNCMGFAVHDEWRISVSAYPEARISDLKETLLHELVHLHVGEEPGRNRWHGRRFRQTIKRAMGEGYGIRGVNPRSSLHGAYADAIEREERRARERPKEPELRPWVQLELGI
jgi:SprT-like family protein